VLCEAQHSRLSWPESPTCDELLRLDTLGSKRAFRQSTTDFIVNPEQFLRDDLRDDDVIGEGG
jgi:hypothetical protein